MIYDWIAQVVKGTPCATPQGSILTAFGHSYPNPNSIRPLYAIDRMLSQ